MNVIEGKTLADGFNRTCDVLIVGSGAGGSVAAARLASMGLDVVVVEEGGFHTREDFARPDERWSYPMLYQDRGGRSTADLGITILQGRAVGGGTLVNWTSCFRTPERILDHWEKVHGTSLSPAVLKASFEAVEERLHIRRWPGDAVNANNDVLRRGATALGWASETLRRNVKGCANSGLCGLGCPVDAKQSMHLTFLAGAVGEGATVYSDVRAARLEQTRGRVTAVHAVVMERGAIRATPVKVTFRPRVVVCSGGAINTPALLLRSGIDRSGRVGARTFLHPVTAVVGRYQEKIQAFYGAPQSVSSHEFVDRGPDEIGYFLEVAPLQPMLIASAGWVGGQDLNQQMQTLPHLSAVIALHVDGVLPGDEGGTVRWTGDRIQVDYPVSASLAAAMKHSHRSAAQVHLAAGAKEAFTTHPSPVSMASVADLDALDAASFGTHQHAIFTAHQMGGCAMGADPTRHVVDLNLRVRGTDNLFVVDGSVFPTSLGVNPSQTIYSLAHHFAPAIGAEV